jgi:hypothetical protein
LCWFYAWNYCTIIKYLCIYAILCC